MSVGSGGARELVLQCEFLGFNKSSVKVEVV